MLPEYQTRATEILADILRPSLREADFETEKKVILEEIQMFEDQPPFGADDKCRAAFFGDHPLGRSVLGTLASIEALPVAAMRDYFRRRYAPGNIVLAAAGRVDFDRMVADCRRACGDWEPAECARVVEPARPRSGFQRLTRASATQQYLMQMSPGPAARDDDRYAAKVLAIVLGDDSGSRLFWELVDPGIAEVADLSHAEYQGAGVFYTQINCAPEDAEEVYRAGDADLRGGPCRGHHGGRTAAGQEQGPLATRARQRAAQPADVRVSAATGSIAASIGRWKRTSTCSPRSNSITSPTCCSAIRSSKGRR